MVPLELALRNFMCYRGDSPPLNLDGLHIACLSGENGAGKSALLDAMTWVLWGKARMSDDELISQGESEMLVSLNFLLAGQCYRVVRRRQRSRSKSSGRGALELQIWQQDRWRPIGENTLRETQHAIDTLLRMKYETFINASFLLQGRADEFTSKTPGERKQVLADILDLSEYARLEERARKRMKELEGQIRGIDGSIEQLQSEAEKAATYAQMVASAETRLAELTAALESAEEEQRRAAEQLQALKASAARLADVRTSLAKLRTEQHDLQQRIATHHAEIAEDEATLQRETEILAGIAALDAARQHLEHLDGLRPRYDELQEQRRHYQDALKDELRTLQSDLDGLQREAARLQSIAGRQPTVQAALDAQQQRLEALAPAIEALGHMRQQLADLDERISRANVLLLRQNDLNGQISQRRDSLIAVREEQKRRITSLERQLHDLERWQSDLEHARQQQQAAESLTQQLATLRDTISTTTARVGELRALCDQFNQRANDIKQRKALLDPSADDATCPLCQSDLGHAGITNILASYEQEITDLREQYRTAKRQADQEETSQKQISRDADTLEKQLTRAQRDAARIEPLEQQLAQAGEWQSEMEQAHTTLADVEQRLANEDYATEEHEALLTVEAELLDLGGAKPISPSPTEKRGKTAKAPVLEMLNRERKALLQQQHSLEQQREQRTGIESELATLRHELEQIAAAAAALPATEERIATLSATIEQGDFGHALRTEGRAIEARIAELGYSSDAYTAAREAVQALDHWSDEQHRLNNARSRLENNRNTLQWAEELLERRAAEIAQLQGEETTLSKEVRALPAAEQHTRACDEAVSSHRRDIQVVQRDLYEKQTLQRKAEEAAQQLAERHKERAALLERQSLFHELGEACGKKGVQAMLIETAIPEIEREANRLLGRITGNQMHLTFEMQRDTRKGDTVETLDIKIADAVGTRNYSAFSGGEAMRINFAIRVALSRLLAHRAGASLETLVIDEGFGALDADGRERFVEAITSVQHDFKRILVITHLQELKDRFPVHIEITRTTHGSMWALV